MVAVVVGGGAVFMQLVFLPNTHSCITQAARPLLQRRATFTLRKLAAIVRGGGSDESYLRRLFVLQTLTDFIPVRNNKPSRIACVLSCHARSCCSSRVLTVTSVDHHGC